MKKLKLVDEYGELTEKIKILQKRQEEIREELEKWEDGSYLGENFNITIIKSERVTYDPKVITKLTKQDVLKVITIKSDIKDYLPKSELNKFIAKTTVVTSIRTSRIKGGNK